MYAAYKYVRSLQALILHHSNSSRDLKAYAADRRSQTRTHFGLCVMAIAVVMAQDIMPDTNNRMILLAPLQLSPLQ
jgi:hypothetical protein